MRRFLDLRYLEVLKLWLALARVGTTLPREPQWDLGNIKIQKVKGSGQ